MNVIFGCGDVGRRIARYLVDDGTNVDDIFGLVNSQLSKDKASAIGVNTDIIDLDRLNNNLLKCQNAAIYYTVAPQKNGYEDLRTNAVLKAFFANKIVPKKIVLISTTGVYGDCNGEWVDEQSDTNPQTDRGKRRLSSEQQWLQWGDENLVPVSILRAPGIYANSRIPKERIAKGTPVVVGNECGFTNRVHAEDLARACILAMNKSNHAEIYNATDGTPGKIGEYLQAAAQVIGMPPLEEISMQQAQRELSEGMLSYLSESRKISNRKLLDELGFELKYPDFRVGLFH